MAGDDDTVRVNLSLSRRQKAWLDQLAEFGLHGHKASEVARYLVIRELERLYREGFIDDKGGHKKGRPDASR